MEKQREGPWGGRVLDPAVTLRCCEALDKSPNCSGLGFFHKRREVDSRLHLNLLLVSDGFKNLIKAMSPSTPQEEHIPVHTQNT